MAIETTLTLGKLFHLPLRQTQGLVQSLLALMQTDLEAPDYSTRSRRQGDLQITLPVKAKGEGLHIVVDSSGLKSYGEGEWRTRQYGWSYRRTWGKLHLRIDVETGEIVAQTLTLAGVDEASQLKPMLAQIEGRVDRLGGDGAYDRWRLLRTLAYPSGQTTPIEAVIPPQRKARVRKAKWYRAGQPPLPIRFVLVRDPEEKLRDEVFFCTDLQARPVQILEWVVMRWGIEVTFEEARAHLGIETQRQWSDHAILRTTPCLLGLFSIVTWLTDHLRQHQNVPVQTTAWYAKKQPTFSDCLYWIRQQLWNQRLFVHSTSRGHLTQLPHELIDLLGLYGFPKAA